MAQLEGTSIQKARGRLDASLLGRVLTGRRGRNLREYLTGYLMILPATVLVFTFGIFPVGFALFVSVHKWRLKRTGFIGLDNYVRAIDNLTYIGFFAIAIAVLIGAWLLIHRLRNQAREYGDRPWLLILPGALHAAAIFSFFRWAVLLLPEILDIADKIIGFAKTQALFLRLVIEAFLAESVLPAFLIFIVLTGLSWATGLMATRRWPNPRNLYYQTQLGLTWLASSVGVFLLRFTYSEAVRAYQAAVETGTDPGIWPQVVTIGSGLILLVIAWKIWRSAPQQTSNRAFWLRVLTTMALLVGGWLLIGELPMVIAAGDKDLWDGLKVTVFYSLGTFPFQLTFSMFLAILLFQKLAGSEIFRMLYFLPYVTPTVASAAVFRQLFSVRPQAPVNQALKILGIVPQQWLQEPKGIFAMLAQAWNLNIPDWAGGPSMALVVIMIYSIWVFVGYDTVIYLAGLGNISTELIEAAEIDGAGRWQVFRNIIFPLLSPTTYFLSLISIIGTFKAFNHIWVMRHDFALGTVHTFSVTIFLEFFEKLRYGYASALAFVLFAIILSLTYLNNRIQGSRVFYG